MICAFQSFHDASILLLISLSSFSLFFSLFSFTHITPPYSHPSHDIAQGIIIGYVQRSTLTFHPSLWDRKGPRSLPEHKEWRDQRRYCWRGLLTDSSFFTHCFFFLNSNFVLQSNALATIKSIAPMCLFTCITKYVQCYLLTVQGTVVRDQWQSSKKNLW